MGLFKFLSGNFGSNKIAMQTIYQIALVSHIIAGAAALLSGTAALFLRKFSSNHPKAGKVFFISTLGVAFSALFMAMVKPNMFLLTIGIFTFFQTYAGYRSIWDKSLQPSGLDLLVWLIGAINGLAMVMQGNIVIWVFGGIQIALVLVDLRTYIVLWRGGSLPNNAWLRRHLGMMLGAFTAVVTAFIVVNTSGYWWQWLTPVALLMPLIVYWNIKISPKKRKMSKFAVLLVFSFFVVTTLQAQPYMEGGKTRHRFAQLNVGVDVGMQPGNSARSWAAQGSGWQETTLPNQMMTRLIIGGTHFWGHGDFLIAIPVYQFQSQGYQERVETSFRFFPKPIENNKIRPYLGISHRAMTFSAGQGGTNFEHRFPLSAGVYFNRGNHLLEAGVSYTQRNTLDYAYSPTQILQAQMPALGFRLGYKWMLETTLSAEKDWQSGRTQRLTDTLGKLGRLDGFTFGIGPSVGFFLQSAQGLEGGLTQHRIGNIFPELMAGYYLHGADIQLSAVYRGYKSKTAAYGLEQQLQRRALTLEAYKFVVDYHGFVPFVGPALSYESWSAETKLNGAVVAEGEFQGVKPGLTFGWDIRPNRLQFFYLRTALRWFPNMTMQQNNGVSFSLDQLEVNFIQLVVLPGRMF